MSYKLCNFKIVVNFVSLTRRELYIIEMYQFTKDIKIIGLKCYNKMGNWTQLDIWASRYCLDIGKDSKESEPSLQCMFEAQKMNKKCIKSHLYFFFKEQPCENPYECLPMIKPSALIMKLNSKGIKRVERLTSPTLERDISCLDHEFLK